MSGLARIRHVRARHANRRTAVRCVAGALALALLTAPPTGAADRASESTVRAALVYNFAKFTDWPPGVLASGEMISLCVVDDPSLADELEGLVAGRKAGQRGLVVRRLRIDESLRSCHVVYAGGLDDKRAARLLEVIGPAPILTMSDYEDFAQRGGVANFFVEGGKVRFAINVATVNRARLQVSSKLLTLARIVK